MNRVAHQHAESMNFASAALMIASLNACGVKLHWLMMKLKMIARSDCTFAS
jgi:hypothetical protein